MTLQDKVNIVYNRVHLDTLKNKKYPLTDRIYCKRYSVPLRDDRATKKNIEAFIKAKDSGYLKDFHDFCNSRGMDDGRIYRNGKKSIENSEGGTIPYLIFMFILTMIITYCLHMQEAILIVYGLFLILYKVLGRRKAMLITFVLTLILSRGM